MTFARDLADYADLSANNQSNRNYIINGAMQVAQRATSVASITGNTDGYYTADRFNATLRGSSFWTQSVENDAPTGSGFRKSLKMLCTTAVASPTSTNRLYISQLIEGQNVQPMAKGTASAKPLVVSFWVKANLTGTYVVQLFDFNNSRQVSKAYTISASATWEKKTISFPADTTGVLTNDNNSSFEVRFWLLAGSSFSSGTMSGLWESSTNANSAVGQVNLAAATSNYWQVTGVQMENGTSPSPFEFKKYADNLRECQRYYYRLTTVNSGDALTGFGECYGTTAGQTVSYAPQIMRATAATVDYANIGWIIPSTGSGSITSLTLPTTGTIGNVIFLGAATGSGMGAGKVFYIRSTSAGGYIGIGCEL
jgi:hypothetical protein